MPPERDGPRCAWRAVEQVWRWYFKPPRTPEPYEAHHESPRDEAPRVDRRKGRKSPTRPKTIPWRGVEYPSRAALAKALAPLCDHREATAIVNALAKLADDGERVVTYYAGRPKPKSANLAPPAC